MDVLDAVGLPDYLHPRSNHLYSFKQKIAVALFMSCERISFGRLRTDLGKYRGFIEQIYLRNVPDGSTICKFLERLNSRILER